MKLDIGAGKNPREGFEACDKIAFDGVKHVFDAGNDKWPFEDNSVDEVHSSHFLEHLTNFNDKWERIHFFNEMYRVLKHGGKATIIVPHWNSNRWYGDPTHKEPLGEMAMYYLSKEWRKTQAPHTDSEWNQDGYECDYIATWGYGLHPALLTRNQEYQQYAQQWYKEAVQDLHISLEAKK